MAKNKSVPVHHIPTACFAPELTDELVSKYTTLIAACDNDEVKEAGMECLACVKKWWELPESQRKDVEVFNTLHGPADNRKLHKYELQPLEEVHVKELWDVVPWQSECERMGKLFDTVTDTALRNALFHLLWFCTELTLDREPLTRDKLVPA